MKQLAQYQDGRLELQEVPAPQAPPGGILVRTTCSVISPGTEKMKVEQAKMSLLQKAKARPDQVRKVLDTARTLGWKSAYEKVKNRLESPTPLGYSAAGVVVEVHPSNTRFRVGDRVACGGAECAFHAELIGVPDLLAAPIPDDVEDWQAAYTTLASISMQGVRQADVKLGDQVVVLGQGLVGQLATSLLKASGVRVLAVDYDQSRLDIAMKMGAELVINPKHTRLEDAVDHWTQGFGVDAFFICIGGKTREPSDLAIRCLRDRGTMVIVGIYDAELEWKTAYMKDIQVKYSRSYGPGRYDAAYEWGGHDYPIGYVKWTENRNFQSCLELMRSGALDLNPVTTRRSTFDSSLSVYEALMTPGNQDIGVVLDYQGAQEAENKVEPLKGQISGSTKAFKLEQPLKALHVVGAGNFAKTMLLPHLKGKVPFGSIINQTGLSAKHVKEKFGFQAAGTDAEQAFAQEGDAILISTRHHLHAPMVKSALQSHQHVFVEKPLCLTIEELSEIQTAVEASHGSVMVGFNRRYAPATVKMKEILAQSPGSKSISCHVFAGTLAPDHWYANFEQSGGRLLGEACHFFDLFCYLIGSEPVMVQAHPVGELHGAQDFVDSFVAQVHFKDGSNAQLIYSAEGDYSYPKETIKVFGDGLVLSCENFLRLDIHQKRQVKKLKYASKGHQEEMHAWSEFLLQKQNHPMEFKDSAQSMRLTFAAQESISRKTCISL